MADTEGTQEVQQQTTPPTEYGPGGVPKGSKTSEYYRVENIPNRFDNPGKCYNPGNPVFSNQMEIPAKREYTPSDQDWFQGYNIKPVSAVYRTSNSDYGSRPPSVHTMPTKFCAKSQKFSEIQNKKSQRPRYGSHYIDGQHEYATHSAHTAVGKEKKQFRWITVSPLVVHFKMLSYVCGLYRILLMNSRQHWENFLQKAGPSLFFRTARLILSNRARGDMNSLFPNFLN